MKVVITGGAGFIGRQLCSSLLRRGAVCGVTLDRIVLYDALRPTPEQISPVMSLAEAASVPVDVEIGGSLVAAAKDLLEGDQVTVFHLASMMSGPSEDDMHAAWDTNVTSIRALLDACSMRPVPPRFVFSSSTAAFPPSDFVADDTKFVPHNTYGMTKAVAEMLVNDYSRKGVVDGRCARLPTVIVRPGAPNAATTSAFSGVVREPLAGIVAELPFDLEYKHPVCSHRNVVDCLVQLAEVDVSSLGVDRAVNLPSVSVSLIELIAASRSVAEKLGVPIAGTTAKLDPRINAIVTSFCSEMDSSRALALGLPPASSVEDIIMAYVEDFMPHLLLGSSQAESGSSGSKAATDLSPSPTTGPPNSSTSPASVRVASASAGSGGASHSDRHTAAKPSVGFIGLGFMGAGMATNLSNAGFELLLHNRTRSKAEELASALSGPVSVVDSAAEVAAVANVVLTCLPTEAAGDAVFFGPAGVFATLAARGDDRVVVADHSTVSPATSARCHAAARDAGVSFLDAPISGGPGGAKAGTLSIMAGGEDRAFQVALPVFQAMGSHIVRMGEQGTGTAAKLVNQALVGAHNVAACEALNLARKLGVRDLEALLQLLARSFGHSRMLERCGPFAQAYETNPGDDGPFRDSPAPLRLLTKDLRIILASAAGDSSTGPEGGSSEHVPMPVTQEAKKVFERLATEGKGDYDISYPYLALRQGSWLS